MARRGNTSVSSLLRSAQSEFNRVQTYNDSLAAYEFQLSDKSGADFQKYDAYLNGRIGKLQSSDPSKALSLDKTRTSAYRSFNSSEISRASTSVLYGDINNRQKYGQMVGLYQQALANGDQALAQSIEGQLASLSRTIQTEEQANADRAERNASRLSAANEKAFKAGVSNEIKKRDLAIKLIQNSLSTGKPVIDPDTGEKISYNSRNFAQSMGQAMLQKEQILNQAIESGVGDTFAYQSQLESLRGNGNYQKFASTGLLERLNREGGGESPFAVEVDPITGERSLTRRKVVGASPLLGPDGKPLGGTQANKYETNALSGSSFTYGRKNEGGQEEFFKSGVYDVNPGQLGAKEGQQYYIDPVTGRQLYVRRDPKTGTVQRGLALPGGGNPFDEEPILPEAGSEDSLAGAIDVGKKLLRGPVGLATDFVADRLFNRSAREEQMRMQKAAEAAAALAEQRRLAGLQRVITANPSVTRLASPAPVPKPKTLISNVLPGTPAQVFKAVAGPNPSKPAVASGIAAVVGYDRYANIFR